MTITSKIEIIKRAASESGNGGLVSLDDNEEIARLVEEHYEAIVGEMLTQHTWPWARRVEPMTALPATPEYPWRKMWARPPGMLALQYVSNEYGVRVDHEERDTVASAAIVTICTDNVLYAVGTSRVSEDRFPPDFAMSLQKRMTAVFRKAISEQTTEGNRDDQVAGFKEQRARVRATRSSTATDPSEWDLTLARRRSGAWRIGR